MTTLLLGLWVLLIGAAPGAGGDPCDGLRSRLPGAFRLYEEWLVDEGRGDEQERSSEEWQDDALMQERFTESSDSTWTTVDRKLDTPDSGFAYSCLPDESVWLEWAGDQSGKSKEDADCRELLCVRFLLPGAPVSFTIGHAVEGCTDVPLMLWEHQGRRYQHPLPDFLGYNVRGLWCTEQYLVFHLWVGYEYGGESEGLGFWNLDTGRMSTIIATTRMGFEVETKTPEKDPTEGLGLYLRDLRGAGILQDGALVLVRNGSFELAFWPESKEWLVEDSRPPK